MLGLFLPKIPGFKNMNVSIIDTFTDSPLLDRLENCQTIVPTYKWSFTGPNHIALLKC